MIQVELDIPASVSHVLGRARFTLTLEQISRPFMVMKSDKSLNQDTKDILARASKLWSHVN